MSNTVAHCN